jgi:hypothetical protein
VVDVLHREPGLDPVEIHRLKLEHDEGPRRVLGQGLIHPERDLGVGHPLALTR